ncbi:synaptonemal complex protein 2-like isoform X2 [Arvicanthis niloticus]|uniref:synaptonemal complex protein 2-like isoform X2 n=1 Tax=Arvicanthis niloticus TaxID=61156 RepID=UPI00402BDE6B
MVSWFETMTGFLITKVLASEALLTKAVEDFLDTALIISRHSRKGTIQMLDSFILCLGFLVADGSVKPSIQQEALRTLNCILNAAPQEERRRLSSAEDTRSLMKELAKTILTVGDYSQQVALSEALCRVSVGTQRNELAAQWFDDAALAEAFKEIKNREFETDCRQFLNFLNNRLGDQRRVYSFPCLAAFADDQEMRKPADEKLEEFWIDFNLGSQSVTFYIDNAESALWEPVQLLKEAIVKFTIIENDRRKMFIVYPKQPIVIGKREAKKIEIHFDRQLGISQASVRALGEDKQVSSVLEKEDGEISSIGEREAEDAEESTILPEFVDAEAEQQCLITRCFNVQSVPAQTKSEDHSPENSKPEEPEQVTSEYEFPMDVQEPSIQNEASKLNNTKEDSASSRVGEQDRRMSLETGGGTHPLTQPEMSQGKPRGSSSKFSAAKFNDRKHYFLESKEDSSSSTSKQSWTQNRKRKSLRTYSQRRKPGVSSLRILPLSPVRSGHAPEKDEAELTPLWKGISRRNDSTLLKISETKLQDSSVPLTLEASTEKIELQSRLPSSSSSSVEHPEVEEENVPEIVNQEPFMGNSSFKHKLENLEHRGEMPNGSVITLKQSRLEDAPELPIVPDKSTPSQEDVPENANSSAFKTAFENFTRDLKKKFELMLKPKEILLSSEKAKEVPACLISLWKRIHMCRLDKLERFHSSVLQELSSLEKDLQTLTCLEKDALASSLSVLSLGPKNLF